MEIWPNFFIVGAPKSGTTSLFMHLDKIPEVYLSPVKEPHFFSPSADTDTLRKPIKEKKKYLELFKNVKNEIAIGEASADYLRDIDAPKMIHDVIPNAKIIMILRNPVDRAYSHYLHNIRIGKENLSFKESLKQALENDRYRFQAYLESGSYYEQVKRYLDLFGEKNVKILIFEEFVSNTTESVKQVLSFLGIEIEINEIKNEVFNPFRKPRGRLARRILSSKSIAYFVEKSGMSQSHIQNIREKILERKIPKPQLEETERKLLQEFYQEGVLKLKNNLKVNAIWDL